MIDLAAVTHLLSWD